MEFQGVFFFDDKFNAYCDPFFLFLSCYHAIETLSLSLTRNDFNRSLVTFVLSRNFSRFFFSLKFCVDEKKMKIIKRKNIKYEVKVYSLAQNEITCDIQSKRRFSIRLFTFFI